MVAIENQQTTPVVETAGQNVETTEQRETAAVTAETQKMLDYQRLAAGTQIESNNLQLEVRLDELLTKYKNLFRDVQRLSGNNPTKAHFEEVLKDCIKDIKTMKKNVKKNKSNSDFNILSERVNQMDNILKEYDENYQQLILGREDIVIRSFIDSKQDAKREAKYQELESENQVKINRLLNDAAAESLKGRDQKEYKQYLVDVINGNVKPDTHPFYKKNEVSFNFIKNTDPNFYNQITPQGTVAYDTYIATYQGQRVACRQQPRTFSESLGNTVADALESCGINKEHDPRKRQAWVNAGKLVGIGGAIFLGFKFLQNLFSKSDKNEHKWLNTALYGGGLLALLNFGGIKKWVQDVSGKHPGEQAAVAEALVQNGAGNEQNEMVTRFVDAPVTTLSVLSFIPFKTRKDAKIIEEKNNKLVFNKNNYMTYVNTLVTTGTISLDEARNLDKASDKLQDSDFLGNGLSAFGINDMKKVDELATNPDMTLKDSATVQANYRSHVESMTSGIHSELYKKGLIAKDVNALEKITHEYKEGEDLDKQIIQWIEAGLLSCSINNSYDLKDMMNDPKLNLAGKSLNGFTKTDGTPIVFEDYGELFHTLALTNNIMKHFKGKTAVSNEPFYISWPDNKIKFNNSEWYSLLNHDILTVKNKTLKLAFSSIYKNKDEYSKYLNKLWAEQ